MKTMKIYEPAMCCSTGVCGASIDPELLRMSLALKTLEQNGIKVERYNLNNAPNQFVQNVKVKAKISSEGVDCLPLILVDGEIVIEKRYPTNAEMATFLGVPVSHIENESKKGCGCKKGGCC